MLPRCSIALTVTMATDLARIVESIRSCYAFEGVSLVAVGAGGGQLVDVYRDARRVIAIDTDAEAVARLEARLRSTGIRGRFELVAGDFLACTGRVDAVLFEFSLHEMPDPLGALEHARALGTDIVIADHAPDSRWAWHAAEEDKVAAAWAAVERLGAKHARDFGGEQVFEDRAALEARLASQGPEARRRAGELPASGEVRIPMKHRVAVL